LILAICAWAKEADMPVIKIYYDNTSVNKKVKPAWGFSALIKYKGRNILFDTGGNAKTLLSNMKAMGSDPKYIWQIMISHDHWDHTGGIKKVLHADQKVYLLRSFSRGLKDQVKSAGAKVVEVNSFQEIMPGLYTTGELGKSIKEQSLVIDSEKGLIIVNGCSHPGIVEIVREAKGHFKKEIFLVLGGFHLYDLSDEKVKSIIKELRSLGVKKMAPCHCTGEKAIALFQKEYGKDFIKVGAGSIVDVSRL
jgi:7,8-dihydropterin-6-yl-methyl-4-(beta-D-ribofuranosyl)aminobenzene 5'-phosphate synthase